jgi:hypothetical protein
VVDFEFEMPFLSPGVYSVSAAVSEGDPFLPIPMHYKPDLISIEPLLGKRTVHGVFAIPDMNISIATNQ